MSLEIWVPWPSYPIVTRTGQPSRAKTAGKPLKWLSSNVINNLPPPMYRAMRDRWHRAAQEAAKGLVWTDALPCLLKVSLWKRTKQNMDSAAIWEGVKPIVDGLVAAGVWPDDNDSYIRGIVAVARKSPDPTQLGAHIEVVSL